MPVLLTLIIGSAVGFLVTRIYGINLSVPATVGLGVVGALVGVFTLRGLATVFAGTTTILAIFIGGLVGVMALLWLYKTYINRK